MSYIAVNLQNATREVQKFWARLPTAKEETLTWYDNAKHTGAATESVVLKASGLYTVKIYVGFETDPVVKSIRIIAEGLAASSPGKNVDRWRACYISKSEVISFSPEGTLSITLEAANPGKITAIMLLLECT